MYHEETIYSLATGPCTFGMFPMHLYVDLYMTTCTSGIASYGALGHVPLLDFQQFCI